MRSLLTTLPCVLLASIATAHEGHGVAGEGHTANHYVTEPVHAGVAVLAIVSAVAVWSSLKAVRNRQAGAQRDLA